MTSPITPPHCPDPLRNLPSLFAMPDLRRRVSRVLRELSVGDDELVALLGIDPLTVVRGLRAASAAIYDTRTELPTIRSLVAQLGTTQTRQLLRVELPGRLRGGKALQKLWRHAIATAIAARDLAARTGLMEPDAAYLAGLLHDLPEWIRRLTEMSSNPDRPRRQPNEWLRYWQLPAPLVSLLLAIELAERPRSAEDPPDAVGLVRAAELLAELAGFAHPASDEDAFLATIRDDIAPHEMQVATELRRQVEAALRSFGMSPEITERELGDGKPATMLTPNEGRFDQAMLSVLSCSRAERYRAIVTVVTATAVRYGGYDRAFYAKWQPGRARLTLRSKADLSARRIATPQFELGEREQQVLQRTHETQSPQLLWDDPASPCELLRRLSTDELMIVPLNPEFATPSFLLLDRSLSLRPLDMTRDIGFASALGMVGSLLSQNLLLRRRRQRAQEFSLTDALTHLFNRRFGIYSLEQAISRAEREGDALTVLMCDLDHFKRLNDTLGHLQGDAALVATADVLRQSVRKSDTVCRYGGEEFLVVLPDTTSEEATVLATRMFTAVHARGEELALPITISIGLTCYQAGDTVETLLHRADRALYASKDYGRNRFSADVEEEPPPQANRPGGPEPRPGR